MHKSIAFIIKDQLLYFHIEQLMIDNKEAWRQYKQLTSKFTDSNRGIINTLIYVANDPFPYEEIKDVTGFDLQEYKEFIDKAILFKNNLIMDHINTGSHHMDTSYEKFISYITINPYFCITDIEVSETMSLKQYFKSYRDLIITVGTNFSDEKSFSNHGIFRNPYWVFENKYCGLSMILHALTGLMANNFYPSKKLFKIKPVGSMLCIIKKYLLRGDGYMGDIDIKDIDVKPTSPEIRGFINIKIDSLLRIIEEHAILLRKSASEESY